MTRIEIFANYLKALGFDMSPMAWHLSGIPMADSQHVDLASMFGRPVNG